MPNYSSHQFYKDWRYSVKKDFTNPSTGEQVPYAPDGFRTWGNEVHKLPVSKSPSIGSVSSDGSLIAIAVDEDIFVYETVNFNQITVCKGHVSKIDALAFRPGNNSKVLVSSAQNNYAGTKPVEPTIIIWDLDAQQEHPPIDPSIISRIASQAASTVVQELQQVETPVELSSAEEKDLTADFEPSISRAIKTHGLAKQRTLPGRLQSNFQSEVFSPSGTYLLYMPGERPHSNGNDVWDVKVYSMYTHQNVLTLSGHTDALMWMGFSPDERLIGTVAWDMSVRIWDAFTGREKFVFKTGGQNWTGAFSPDSKRFAGTCGDGTLYVWEMDEGAELVKYKEGERNGWLRALSWSADGKMLAVGGGHGVVQERILSVDACLVGPEYKRSLGSYLECCGVRFVDGGRKVVVLTSGDGGIETYDLMTSEKWRFARPGIDPERAESSENEGQIKSKNEDDVVRGGYSMEVWEDKERGKILVASMDGDAVRIWDLPMTKEDS
ncbi:putative WD repeat-containing protein [Lachnellula suecica]|uniref:Putative WD repeat-containing protein n=1 Tax=Lachnellula suecica TaxID=602035 RepID=A0A8T9C6A2_9HELO|nr:putative WD repeat-containing protein [Lachnellula suecica]